MRIVLTWIAMAACAWALPAHGQEHAPAPAAPTQAAPSATHAPVSAMGRAMAALLDQAVRAQAATPRADAAKRPLNAVSTRSPAAPQDTRIADEDTTAAEVAVH
jgi:hypothetical protein